VIKRGVRHQYWRADRDLHPLKAGPKDEKERNERALWRKKLASQVEGSTNVELEKDLIIIESTDPSDRDKEVYFRQILSLLEERKGGGIWETLWMLWVFFVVFNGHDNFPVVRKVTRRFGNRVGKALESVVTHFVLNVASVLGWAVGLRSTYDEYTPVELRIKDKREKQRDL